MEKAVTNMEFANVRELVEIASQVGIVCSTEKEDIILYLELMYKNGYFLDVTDVVMEGEEIRIPLTLKALVGLLNQREKELVAAREQFKKHIKQIPLFDTGKLQSLLDALPKNIATNKNDLMEAINKMDFFNLYEKNNDIMYLIPLVRRCIISNGEIWYDKAVKSINISKTNITKHTPGWAKGLANAIE